MIDISVVIPTRNRRVRLRALLGDLGRQSLPPREILIADASDEPLPPSELAAARCAVRYLRSAPSVCAQRNRAIRAATSPWIFLCDDDVEVPPDYLARLAAHLADHPQAGAVSGLVLEQKAGRWISQHPTTWWPALLWARVFQLGLWGEIHCRGPIGELLASHYRSRGNHISSAGWPVLTDFRAPYFRTPVYALGAALIRRDWLLQSPFDERLDRRGYGDNYGVAVGFPGFPDPGIHVVTSAAVRHHKEQADRPPGAVAYAARVLALDLFLTSGPARQVASRGWLLWSLLGNGLLHAITRDGEMFRASLRTAAAIATGRNRYRAAEAAA